MPESERVIIPITAMPRQCRGDRPPDVKQMSATPRSLLLSCRWRHTSLAQHPPSLLLSPSSPLSCRGDTDAPDAPVLLSPPLLPGSPPSSRHKPSCGHSPLPSPPPPSLTPPSPCKPPPACAAAPPAVLDPSTILRLILAAITFIRPYSLPTATTSAMDQQGSSGADDDSTGSGSGSRWDGPPLALGDSPPVDVETCSESPPALPMLRTTFAPCEAQCVGAAGARDVP